MTKSGVNSNIAWQAIRALRATPTGSAAGAVDRRQTFAASLRQAEELAVAAQAVGYAAKPLPLFYSLSQAGRAIAAAHLTTSWVLRGHGLRVNVDAQRSLLETTVEPAGKGGDSFRGVAAAVGSPTLSGAAQLGELWAANPDLRDVPIPTSMGAWHRALEISIGVQSLGLLAPNADPETHPVTTGGILGASVDVPGKTGTEVIEALKPYPTLQGAFGLTQVGERAGADDNVHRGADQNGTMQANIAVEAPSSTNMMDLWRRQRALASIVEIDERQPRYPAPHLIGFALPDIAGGPSPHPLMLWWALLLGLSSLARYEPAAWTAAIDPDASELAVSLERVLDVASERVPVRILQSLQMNQAAT
jgi:hypothetical protein